MIVLSKSGWMTVKNDKAREMELHGNTTVVHHRRKLASIAQRKKKSRKTRKSKKSKNSVCSGLYCKSQDISRCFGGKFCSLHRQMLQKLRYEIKHSYRLEVELEHRLRESMFRGTDAGHLYQIYLLLKKVDVIKVLPSFAECEEKCRLQHYKSGEFAIHYVQALSC